MARSRNIKPSFFTNDKISECSILARLLFIGLWTIADREGRLLDRPKKIKAEVLPYDDCNCDDLLNELCNNGFIIRYDINDVKYIHINNFIKHQNPHHMEVASEIPAPNGVQNKYNHLPISVPQRKRIMNKYNKRCVICSCDKNLHIDHIIPISKGGTSEDSNLRVLCDKCNLSKGSKEHISTSRLHHLDNTMMSSCNHLDENVSHPTESLLPLTLTPIPLTSNVLGDFPKEENTPEPKKADNVNIITSSEQEAAHEEIKKDDDVILKKWNKDYSQSQPHEDFEKIWKYITDRLPTLKRQSAAEINTWLEHVSCEDILRHIDWGISNSTSPPYSFKYFTPSIMTDYNLRKEIEEQKERMMKKYAESE